MPKYLIEVKKELISRWIIKANNEVEALNKYSSNKENEFEFVNEYSTVTEKEIKREIKE